MARFLSRSLSLIALMVLVGACSKSEDAKKKMGVIERQDVIQKINVSGTLRGIRQTQIKPGYSGYVGRIHVKVGEVVKAGQPLVSVTQTLNQPLAEIFPIRSPFAGTITQILKTEGEYISTGSDSSNGILVLNDMSELWIDATVPEVDIAKISVGLEASIRVNALTNKRYKGVVRTLALSPKINQDRWDRGRVEYPTEIQVTDLDDSLKPGMTIVADIISAKAERVLSVRHEFIHKDSEGFYVVDEEGARHRIEVGLSNEEMVEIKSGAKEGLRIEMMDFGKL